MLRSVEFSLKYKAPVFGVNYGKLGFLSDCSMNELKKAIHDLKNKRFQLESRVLLDVKVFRQKQQILHTKALNDAVLHKEGDVKLIDIRLYVNKQFVYKTRSDGIVVSTPTGSTAYSLSAGGPIMSPAMRAIIVTPLNPHILTIRPMVFGENESIELRLPVDNQAYLQVDGISKCKLECNDVIIVRKSRQSVNFVKLTQKTFYKILRKKLNMGKN